MKYNLKKKIFWFAPALIVTLGIFFLSTFFAFPMQEIKGVNNLDKIEHCLAYTVLVMSFLVAYKKGGILTKKKTFKVIIFSIIYGFSLELIQYSFFSHRFFEWIDVLANLLGVIIGYGLFILFSRMRLC